CVHGLLSGNGPENVMNSAIDKLVLTDTIPLKADIDKIEVVSISKLLADVIQSVVDQSSITSHFRFN
ncbi:MAG TPA: ribose-phosphate pyrophosphokinase, partial [Bacteroidales bacterium]|nr:ribose-phosphate pyrophosphokinase [Bacteroidales bacterium]